MLSLEMREKELEGKSFLGVEIKKYLEEGSRKADPQWSVTCETAFEKYVSKCKYPISDKIYYTFEFKSEGVISPIMTLTRDLEKSPRRNRPQQSR